MNLIGVANQGRNSKNPLLTRIFEIYKFHRRNSLACTLSSVLLVRYSFQTQFQNCLYGETERVIALRLLI